MERETADLHEVHVIDGRVASHQVFETVLKVLVDEKCRALLHRLLQVMRDRVDWHGNTVNRLGGHLGPGNIGAKNENEQDDKPGKLQEAAAR